MIKPLILLAEDEAAIADTVVYTLQTEGFEVQWVTLGAEAIAIAKADRPQLAILDVGLPDISGFDVCKSIRAFSQMPVIFLTARAEEIDRVVGFEIGADDYVTKPFSPRELAARVKAILKRAQAGAAPPDASHGFALDEDACQITYQGVALDLTRYEYRLLKCFLAQPQRVFTREQLMQQAWESPEASMDRTVDAHIKSLRAKLKQVDEHADPIKTHRGMGYSIRP